MRIRQIIPVIASAWLLSLPVQAQAMVEVTRGSEATVFGSCMPTLAVSNRSDRAIDYLQVDLAVRFRDGHERTVELKSAYRYGILRPIAPGASGVLKINADESVPLGGSCGDVVGMRAMVSVCESGAVDCRGTVRVDVGR
jgi:hypothetical protein